MSQLVPCPHCRRHVTLEEQRCPFCEHELDLAGVSPRPAMRERMSRAAAFAFGAMLAGACGGAADDPTPPANTGGMRNGGSGGVSGWNAAPAYGAPLPGGNAGAPWLIAGGGGVAGQPIAGAPAAGGSGSAAAMYGAPVAGRQNTDGGAKAIYGAPIAGFGNTGGTPGEGGASAESGAGGADQVGEGGASGGEGGANP